MATHSGILGWETPWTEERGKLQSMGLQKSWTQLRDYRANNIQGPACQGHEKGLLGPG